MQKIFLVAIGLFMVLAVFCGAAESLLKNGDFSAIEESKELPQSWSGFSKGAALSIEKAGNPEGITNSVKVVPQEKSNSQGSFSQRIDLSTKTPAKLVLTGYIRSEVYNEAFLQVKLYKAKKELKRLSSTTSKKEWAKVNIEIDTAGADRIEVLCRWKCNDNYIGKPCWFTGIKLQAIGNTLAVVGDSTVQNYDSGSERRGWGQMLPEYFTDKILISNYAVGGRSSKTFREEKRWETVLAGKPDYVLIQFGHNDSHEKGRPESTDANGDFKEYMIKYIDEAKAAGITPVFVTPPARRIFNKDGSISRVLKPYADTIKLIAAEKGIVCVDLYTISCNKFRELGEKKTAEYFCNEKDRSHFSPQGAAFLAEQIVLIIKKDMPDLAAMLKPTTAH